MSIVRGEARPAQPGSASSAPVLDAQARPIESFGAVGDGETDDTDAFERAIEWERATTGRQYVELSAGRRYRVTRTLRFDFGHGGLFCAAGLATIVSDVPRGNGIEVVGAGRVDEVTGSWFRGVQLVTHRARSGHAWFYRRARFGHINEDCGAAGPWNHYFHYDNACYGNNILLRPHLEMGGRGRVGIWIGPVCNGLHVVHPEINNPAEVGIEVDASGRSDAGSGPGVNSVVLDHVLTYGCGEAHIRLNGALGVSVRSPRLEAGPSSAPLMVLGDRAGCEGVLVESPWFQGSDHAPTALRVHRVRGLTVLTLLARRISGPVIEVVGEAASGITVVHPIVRETGPTVGGSTEGVVVIDAGGDVSILGRRGGLVLPDRDTGVRYRVVVQGGRLVLEPVRE